MTTRVAIALNKPVNSTFLKKSEYRGLSALYKNSPRNPFQLNSFNSADTEILSQRRAPYLTASTDSIAIEIHDELYTNPETWGYLAVVNSISDLAASGTKPLGMLISAQWKKSHEGKIRDQVYRSMAHALRDFDVPLLGGDSGSSKETVITTTIIGESSFKPLSRSGIKNKDLILVFGDRLGFGPLLSFDFLKHGNKNKWETHFRPKPQWPVTFKFARYFNAAIDSSDGLYNSLGILSEINNLQFEIDLTRIKPNKKIEIYLKKNKIPIEFLIENDLGDLQTCVAISSRNYERIKTQLPVHFILAEAQVLKNKKVPVLYKGKKSLISFPKILEKVKTNYSEALKIWHAQYYDSN